MRLERVSFFDVPAIELGHGTYLTQDFRHVLVVLAVFVQHRGRVPDHHQSGVSSLAAGSQPGAVRMYVDRKYWHTVVRYP